ncbi:MAG: hypothetical protein R3338_12440, partial [Thermoanaerobaculia bacterium]|nr:hypothetical protein [Thermoanaerobaculia bacterium]
FGKLLNAEDREKVEKILKMARGVVSADSKQKINDAIFELQTVSRILTEVMLYNPMHSSQDTPSDQSES